MSGSEHWVDKLEQNQNEPDERETEVGVLPPGGGTSRYDALADTPYVYQDYTGTIHVEPCVEGAIWMNDEDGGMCCFSCILCGERCEMDHGTPFCYDCWRASLDA